MTENTAMNFDYCGVGTFSAMTGIPLEKVANWLEIGMLPCVMLADIRMVNLGQIHSDLLKGKSGFTEGDYADKDPRGALRFC